MPKIKIKEVKAQKEVSAKLKKFQKEFGSQLRDTSQERMSLPSVPREFRRLDSIARLLECASTCTAVYYENSTKKLHIFSNRVHQKKNNNSVESQHIKNMQAVFKLISESQLDIHEIIETLSVVISKNISQEHWRSLEGKSNEEIKNIVKNQVEALICSGENTKEFRDKKSNEDKLNFLISKKVSRLVRDFLKIRDFILNAKAKGIGKGIKEAIDNKRFQINHIDSKDVHAEIRSLNLIIRTNDRHNAYVGISKLCCDHCSLAMKAFNVPSRGTHGQRAKWPLPQFIEKNTNNLKQYVGEIAFETYQTMNKNEKELAMQFVASKEANPLNAKHGRNMYADSSDSDIEFGIDMGEIEIDEDDKKAENLTLEELWEIRNLQSIYPEELGDLLDTASSFKEKIDLSKKIKAIYSSDSEEIENLLALGFSFDKIIDLYLHAYNKFLALSDDATIRFEREVSSEIDTDDIENLYDDHPDLFDSIINNAADLVQQRGLEAVIEQYRETEKKYNNSDGEDIFVDVDDAVRSNFESEDGYGLIVNSDGELAYDDTDSDTKSEQSENDSEDFEDDFEIVKKFCYDPTSEWHSTEEDSLKETLLHAAIYQKDYETAQALLQKGENPNAINAVGLSPLHISISLLDIKMTELLLNYGADLSAPVFEDFCDMDITRLLEEVSKQRDCVIEMEEFTLELIALLNFGYPDGFEMWGNKLSEIDEDLRQGQIEQVDELMTLVEHRAQISEGFPDFDYTDDESELEYAILTQDHEKIDELFDYILSDPSNIDDVLNSETFADFKIELLNAWLDSGNAEQHKIIKEYADDYESDEEIIKIIDDYLETSDDETLVEELNDLTITPVEGKKEALEKKINSSFLQLSYIGNLEQHSDNSNSSKNTP